MANDGYWLRSGIYTVLIKVFSMIFGLGGFYFLVRILDKNDYGAWVLFLMVAGLIEVSRNALIQNALVKHLLSSEKEEHATINTASLVINALITGLSALLLWVVSAPLAELWDAPDLVFMLRFYALTTIVLAPFSQSEFLQQANFDFKGVFWGHFMRLGLLFAYISYIFLNHMEMNLTHLVVVHGIAAFLGMLTITALSKKYFSFSSKIDWSWVKKLFDYGKYVFGTGVSSMILNSIDSWMLGSLMGKPAVANYNTALKITNLVEVPTFSIAAIVFPQSAKRMQTEGKGAAKYLYEKSVGALLAIIIPGIIFVLLIPDLLIGVIAGDKYIADAVPILCVTMLYGLFMPFGRQFGIILDSIGKPKINFYFILFGACLNIVLNYIFITQFGTIGAAYGTLTTYAITFVGTQILLRKELQVNTLNTFSYALKFYPEFYQRGKALIKNKFFS